MKIFEILENSWNLAKKTYRFALIPAVIVSFIAGLIHQTLPAIDITQIHTLSSIPYVYVVTFLCVQLLILFVSTTLLYAFLHDSSNYKKVGKETAQRFPKILGVTVLSGLLLLPFSAILLVFGTNDIPKILELVGLLITATIVMGVSIAIQSAPLILLEKNGGVIAALKESLNLVKKNFIEKTANYIGSLFIAIVVVDLSAFVVSSLLSLLGMGATKLFPTLAQPHANLLEATLKILSGTYEQAVMLLASSTILVTWYKKVTNP